ncbi:hypothetical protein F5Y19DRAFT_481901 [Xylariaceae sp. FL1651]|nr:hypothetical protein F5Y19DRAFT_481901 [Xylariaceae sp. FL1651]
MEGKGFMSSPPQDIQIRYVELPHQQLKRQANWSIGGMESTHVVQRVQGVDEGVQGEYGEATRDAGERDHQGRNDQREKRAQNRDETGNTVDRRVGTKEITGPKLVGPANTRGERASRAQITAMTMARRRCKIRTRKLSIEAIRNASRGRITEVATSQDNYEPVQQDTMHRTSQEANTQVYGGDHKSSRDGFLDQDEIDRQNQEGDDAEVDDLNENDEFGMYLVPLYSTLEETEWKERPELQADIVLVAGLGGHPKETWRAADGTLWPRQLLPDHVKNIRVLSFNYNNTLKGSASQAGIEEHAEDLLVALFNDKEDEDAKLRPIVFVGHSLGGLIIKQALCLAERRFDGKYKSLWEATHGVMFFSTPHYGMHKTLWRTFVRYVLQYDAPDPRAVPTEGMLVEICKSASALEKISENFEPLQQYLCFQTFVESRPMKGIGEPFVNMLYGRLRAPTEHHQTLEGDHLEICKFGKSDDALFLPVWGGIEQLINQAPKSIDRIGRHGKKALYQLCSDEFHSQPLSKKPTQDTCSWVQDRPEFKDWQGGTAGMQNLWISGPEACGKSYLAKHIINEFRENTSRDVIHCFITNSIPSHGGLSAVLRSTMHQALRLDPEIINEFVTQEPQSHGGEREQGVGGGIWSDDKLSSLWPVVMAKVAAQHPMTAVIDGFDELKEDDRQEFFDCLKQFKQNTLKPENLKLLLLSRQLQSVNPEEPGRGFGRYDINLEDTGADISKTVQQDLDRVWATRRFADKTLQPQICEKIREISGGTYLSASLIAGDLSRNREVKSEDSILEDLTRLYSDSGSPKDLKGVYNCIIDRVSKPRNIGALLNQALLWAAFQKEALKPEEFNIAQAVGRAMEKNPTGDITGKELDGFLDGNIAMTLDFHCGHLVKFQDGRLELVHDSLRIYLMNQFGGEESPNAKLASICVTYLAMPHFRNSGKRPDPERMNSWESKVRTRVDKHKFARYASLYWHDHISNAGSSWPSVMAEQVIRGRRLLEDQETGFARCWTEIWWYFTMWPARNFPQDPPVDRTIPLMPKRTTFVATPEERVTPMATPKLLPTEAEEVKGSVLPANAQDHQIADPASGHDDAPTTLPVTLPVNNGGDLPTASNDPVTFSLSDISETTPNTPVPQEILKHQTPAQDETDQLSTTIAMPEQTEWSDEVPSSEEENRNSVSLSILEHQEETGPTLAEQQTGSTPASVIAEEPAKVEPPPPSNRNVWTQMKKAMKILVRGKLW